MRRKENYVIRNSTTPKRVTLSNGRTFLARYERLPRSELPPHICMNRIYRGAVALARGRRRPQRGQGILSTIKKIAKHPITKQLIRTGAQHLPNLYAKGASKIKNPKLRKALESEVAKKLVKKLHEKGITE